MFNRKQSVTNPNQQKQQSSGYPNSLESSPTGCHKNLNHRTPVNVRSAISRKLARTNHPLDYPTVAYSLPGGPITRLGEWLVRRGLINRADLFMALDATYRHGCRLGDALVWLEALERNQIEQEVRRFERYVNRRTDRDHS